MMSKFFLIGLLLLWNGTERLFSQPLAFPGAEGYGKYTTGGRGGKVIYVTNLNDSGKGSFRAAIKDSLPRIIVFSVSGTIYLQKPLEIKRGNVTIAGQTAPGDGICVAGHSVSIETDNVIMRFMRFRLGDINKEQGDALNAIGHKNLIIDHCSMSWATDECVSFYKNESATLQWCIISESLNASVHKKGDHGYGGIWGGKDVSFHHNLIANNNSRNPRFNGIRLGQKFAEQVDYRNNVIYNWGNNSAYGGELGKYNMVANYYKPGPATPKKRLNRIVQISSEQGLDYGIFYVFGNYLDGNPVISADNWNGGVDTDGDIAKVKASEPFPFESIRQQKAEDAYGLVLKYVGACYQRDSIDTRLLEEVKSGSAKYGATFAGGKKGIIDSQNDVGGWPELKTLPAPIDSDKDGMPDEWEKANNLNLSNASDGAIIPNESTYTNLELYLNNLVNNYIWN
jgi:pectate lyase